MHPGLADVRLKDFGVHVWAVVAQLELDEFDARRAAEDFDLPLESVEAALAYYQRHREVIDARLAAND